MKRLNILLLLSCLAAPLAVTGCDANDEDGISEEYRAQLDAAEILLEDVTDDEEDGTIVEAAFEAGVDDGYYEVVSFRDGEELRRMIDARTGDRLDEERTRREERREDAQRVAAARLRLAHFVRELRRERPEERPVRVRARGSDVEIRTVDRKGRFHDYRRRLAAAEEDRGRDEDRGRPTEGRDGEDDRDRDRSRTRY